MSRVVVTGGAGRLGRSIVSGLQARGHHVISVDRARTEDLDAEQVVTDLRDLTSATTTLQRIKPDSVVQLAAIAVPFSAPEEVILATNTTLAFNVLRAGLDAGATRFAVASSPTVLGYGAPAGWTPTRFPLDENEPVHPWNAYALSKYVAEQVMSMFVRSHGHLARFAAFRPCFVIAPEEWQGAPTQQGHTVRERLEDPSLAAPSLFNYVDARDASDFVATLLTRLSDIPQGETFFVGAADALADRPLAELLPTFLPETGRLAADLIGSQPAFSTAKAERLLGWVATRSWRTELVPNLQETK